MIGMDRRTGRRLSGTAHIKQSIQDILTTPIGSLLMKRDYGSLIPELIDHPTNDANTLRIMSASVMAISQWEPRVSISRAGVQLGEADGQLFIDLEGLVTNASGRTSTMALNVPLGGIK